MKRYKNLSGESGIKKYETGNDYILVEFEDSRIYLYTHATPGKSKVEQMKALALAGRGLSTFISREVRENYAKRIQ